jgi:hypothetical protein
MQELTPAVTYEANPDRIEFLERTGEKADQQSLEAAFRFSNP